MKIIKLITVLSVLIAQITFAETFFFVNGEIINFTTWYKLVKPLTEAENKVIVINFSLDRKKDTKNADITYHTYLKKIIDSIDAQSEKVILLGQDVAGFLIASAIEQVPEKIENIAFITAFNLHKGDNIFNLKVSNKPCQFSTSQIVVNCKPNTMLNTDKIKPVFLVLPSRQNMFRY